ARGRLRLARQSLSRAPRSGRAARRRHPRRSRRPALLAFLIALIARLRAGVLILPGLSRPPRWRAGACSPFPRRRSAELPLGNARGRALARPRGHSWIRSGLSLVPG